MKFAGLKEKIKSIKFERFHLIYVFGFLVNFRPGHPFIYEYLTDSTSGRDLFEREITEELYPLVFYSSAICSLLVFLLLDLCFYNSFIGIHCISGIISSGLLCFSTDFFQLQVAQVFHGFFLATEVAYFVYLYQFIDTTKEFKLSTAYLRSASLGGKFMSFFIAQLLVSQSWATLLELNYVSFAFVTSALFVVPFLPLSKNNIYWTKPEKTDASAKSTLQLLYKNFVESFSDKYVIKWSLWTAFAISGYWHATMFIQPLWKLSQNVNELPVHNGIVEGLSAFVALPGSILMGLGQLDWKFKGDLILTMVSLLQGFFLIFAAWMDHVFLQYMFYVYFVVIYQGILTALWSELAQKLRKGCYGLVFGITFFVGSILSCLLTVLLVFSLKFDYYDQFLLYGIYHIAVSVVYIIFGLVSWYKKNTYEI